MRSEKDGGAYTREKAAVVFLGWLGEIRTRRTNGLKKVPKVGILSLAATCYTSARPEPAGGPASQLRHRPLLLRSRINSRFLPSICSFVHTSVSLFLLNEKVARRSSERSVWFFSIISMLQKEQHARSDPEEILKGHSLSAVIRAEGDILL